MGRSSPESRQLMTHQDVENSGQVQQAELFKGEFTKIVYNTIEEYEMANPAAIDSLHRQIQEKIDPLVYSEEDENKVENNLASSLTCYLNFHLSIQRLHSHMHMPFLLLNYIHLYSSFRSLYTLSLLPSLL